MTKKFENFHETFGGIYREENGYLIPDVAIFEYAFKPGMSIAIETLE